MKPLSFDLRGTLNSASGSGKTSLHSMVRFPGLIVLSAGGVGPKNVQEYACTGVDGIVLSSVFHAKPADLGVTITSGNHHI
ncbi:MAG: hypothetical protein ACL93V_04905 [Candidatus Electrothrix sp. YB6]